THRKTFFQDNRPISVSNMKLLSDSSLQVSFNKPLVANLVAVKTNYRVNGEIGVPTAIRQIDPQTVILIFEKKFQEGKNYQLFMLGLRDIFGVEISRELTVNFEFDLSVPLIADARLRNPYQIILKINEPVLVPKDSNTVVSDHKIE